MAEWSSSFSVLTLNIHFNQKAKTGRIDEKHGVSMCYLWELLKSKDTQVETERMRKRYYMQKQALDGYNNINNK